MSTIPKDKENGNVMEGEPTTHEETRINTESPNDLISKIFPPIAVVLVTAIFYFTGWVYIAHWYSYYGIDAAQIIIPIQLILLHGFPGVAVLILSGSLSLFLFSVYKNFVLKAEISLADLPYVTFIAYLISLASTFATILILKYEYSVPITIPTEVWISSFGLIILSTATALISQLRNVLELSKIPIPAMTLFGKGFLQISPAKVNAVVSLIVEDLHDKHSDKKLKIKRMFEVLFAQTEQARDRINKKESDIKKAAKDQSDQIIEIIKESWRFWVIAIVLFYFLVSISSSALLGEWDATRGGRFMVGDWRISQVTLYSEKNIPALDDHKQKRSSGYQYDAIGLLYFDEKAYYFVDWREAEYYTDIPKVYIVPRADSLVLNLIVLPKGDATIKPTLTATPTPPAVATQTP